MLANLRNWLTGRAAAQNAAETYAFAAGAIYGATVALDARGAAIGSAALEYATTVRQNADLAAHDWNAVAVAFCDGCMLVVRKRLFGARL